MQILAQMSTKMTKIGGSLEAEISADRPKFFFLKNFRNFSKHPPSFVVLAQIAIEDETLDIQRTPQVQTFLFFSKIHHAKIRQFQNLRKLITYNNMIHKTPKIGLRPIFSV